MTRGRAGWTVLFATLFGGLVLGAIGAVIAALFTTAVLVLRPDDARVVFAVASAVLLLAAGSAALLETPLLQRWPVTFSLDRPIAAALAALAGVALGAHLVIAVAADRARDADLLARWDRVRLPAELLREGVAVAAIVLVAVLLRSATDATDLPPGVGVVEDNLEAGIGYAAGLPDGVAVAPLTPVLLFVTGLGAAALAGVSLLVIGAEGAALARRTGRPSFIGAGAAVLVPTVWGTTVPVLLATALLGGAVLLVERGPAGARRELVAGAIAAAALLADPSATAGVICLAVWLAAVRMEPRRIVRLVLPVLGAGGLLAVGAARLVGDRAWWAAGGELPSHDAWLVAVDLGVVVAGIVGVAIVRQDLRTPIGLVVVSTAVATAHLGRGGSPSWVWAPVLLAALALGADRTLGRQKEGGPSSSRSSSVTSRYHMSAQSTQR